MMPKDPRKRFGFDKENALRAGALRHAQNDLRKLMARYPTEDRAVVRQIVLGHMHGCWQFAEHLMQLTKMRTGRWKLVAEVFHRLVQALDKGLALEQLHGYIDYLYAVEVKDRRRMLEFGRFREFDA